MDSTPDRIAYVFGYGSLVELKEPLAFGGSLYPPLPARLVDFRRTWGVAMNNWEATDAGKYFVDPESGLKPHIRVAHLDIEESAGAMVNGLAIPVDEKRLAEFDVREVNYLRIDVSAAFRLAIPHQVFAYRGTDEARERCRLDIAGAEVQVSRGYVSRIREAFAAMGPTELEEYERTTGPLRFPERDLELKYPPPRAR
jgi:hypothetical protein